MENTTDQHRHSLVKDKATKKNDEVLLFWLTVNETVHEKKIILFFLMKKEASKGFFCFVVE